MSIRTRILMGFAVAFLSCAALGGVALHAAGQLNAVVVRFGATWLPHVSVLGDLRVEIMEHRRIVLQHVLSDESETQDALEENLASETQVIDHWFAAAGASFADDRQRELLAAATTAWTAYRDTTPKLLELSRNGVKHIAEQQIQGASNTAYRKLIDNLNTMRQLTVLEAWTGVGIAGSTYKTGWWLIVAAMAACGAVCAGGGLLTVNNVCRPVLALAGQMRRVAAHELNLQVLGRDRHDEVGDMAQALEQFRQGLVEAERVAAAQEADHAAKDRRTARVAQLVAGFDGSVGGVLQTLKSAAVELDATARSMSGIAADTTRQAGGSAEGARQATANVQTVAASAEELAASLREIAHQVGRSTQIIGQATEEARATDANVTELSEAASRIGEVVQADFVNCRADQSVGAERHHRGGARRRGGPRLCRRRRRGESAGQPDRAGDRGHRPPDHRHSGQHRARGGGDRADQCGDRGGERGGVRHCRGGGAAERGGGRDFPQCRRCGASHGAGVGLGEHADAHVRRGGRGGQSGARCRRGTGPPVGNPARRGRQLHRRYPRRLIRAFRLCVKP